MSHTNHVIVLVDMDCFYCQVEENENPQLKGKPLAVVQYNAWRGGGIIAVNYPARDRGVTRHMRGNEAKTKCPEIELVHVPSVRGKADLTKYRDAGKLVANVLRTFTPLLERASVDEAYLDITEAVNQRKNTAINEIQLNQIKNTYVVNHDSIEFLYSLYNTGLCDENNLKLAYGAVMAEEIRAAIFEQTGYTCSAGIAHNKILAKLACGLNKPNKQTVLPQDSIPILYEDLPVHKIRSLGGKFGQTLSEDLGITKMAELLRFSEKDLKKRYDEKTALWLYNIARGINYEPVTTRLVSKSIGCCKNFPGKTALVMADCVIHWLNELCSEISERLEKDLEENNRKAKQMTVGFTQEVNGKDVSSSRVYAVNSYNAKKIADDSYSIIKKHCLKPDGTFRITNLSISVGKFEDCRNVTAITSFFKVGTTIKNTKDADVMKAKTAISELEEKSDFSTDTVDLNEDVTELKFYNEEEDQGMSDDSISNELPVVDNSTKGSFFLQYFEDMKNNQPKIPILRDFDTSRNLEDEDIDPVENDDSLATPGPSKDVNIPTEFCEECNENISISEIVSHKDYHFALSIQKEEKLARKNVIPTVVVKSKETNKSKKRKCSEVQSTTLTQFLQGNVQVQPADEPTQECPHCNKPIVKRDFNSHLDYHIAKKLHMEINTNKSCSSENIKKSTKKNKVTKTISTATPSVVSFFKPS